MKEYTIQLGERIHAERVARDWSLNELADRSSVSRAMLSKIERDEASPTAELLARIANAFGMTLSALIAAAEISTGGQLLKAEDQTRWIDPATGYVRRHISPPSQEGLELIHIKLPPGADVCFPAASYATLHQMIWLLSGHLRLTDGMGTTDLLSGDCYRLGPPAAHRFQAVGPEPAVYLVVLISK